MADKELQALLDPTGTGRGITIVRAINVGTNTNYYVDGGLQFPGRYRYVTVPTANTDAQKNTAIRAALLA